MPLADSLVGKDLRGDPVVKAAVLAAEAATSALSIIQKETFGTIAVSSGGCISHLARVIDGVRQRQPRPGYFVRGGPQTIATYVAMALGFHGPTFTMTGGREALSEAFRFSSYLIKAGLANQICIVVADQLTQPEGAAAIIIDNEIAAGIQLKLVPEIFSNSFPAEPLAGILSLTYAFQELIQASQSSTFNSLTMEPSAGATISSSKFYVVPKS